MHKNNQIWLCGFMGSGKTTVGRILAKEFSFEFVDMDEYIEEKTNMPIPQIFKEKGEDFFRKLETDTMKELALMEKIVISCGGGAVLLAANADIARQNGTLIYIDVDFETCYNRIKDDINRPLVVNNTKEELYNIYKKRIPVYNQNSSYSINGNSTPEETARQFTLSVYSL